MRRWQAPAWRRPPAQARPSSRGWCAAARRRPRLCGEALADRDANLVQGAAFAAGPSSPLRRTGALARARPRATGSSSSTSRTTRRRRCFGTAAPDDLKLIVGVGPVLERMLHQLGVTTYRADRALDRARHRRVRRPPAGVPGAHPPRRLGDAGARAAPEQVRRADPSRSAKVTGPARAARARARRPCAVPGRRAGAGLGLQLAGAEDGRRRAARRSRSAR